MTCYCEHAKDAHQNGRGRCSKKGCGCEQFDRAPAQDDEPGTWTGGEDGEAWKQTT